MISRRTDWCWFTDAPASEKTRERPTSTSAVTQQGHPVATRSSTSARRLSVLAKSDGSHDTIGLARFWPTSHVRGAAEGNDPRNMRSSVYNPKHDFKDIRSRDPTSISTR